MDDQTPAAPSTPTHRPLIPAVDGVSAPNLPGESPPPVATVVRRGPSPASTIGVASARAAPNCRSPRRSAVIQFCVVILLFNQRQDVSQFFPVGETTQLAPSAAASKIHSPSFCDNEGSIHQMALDMFNYSSPPESKSYIKLKHVLGLSEFFYISMGAAIFSENEETLKRMLEGMGLVHIDWKPIGGPAEVIFVETFVTKSSCPLADCKNQPRIFIQTEQKIRWSHLTSCHESPNCVILEFSDYNYNRAINVTRGMSDSIVLLPIMTQTPSRLSKYEPSIPKDIQKRNIDMVFFGMITNRRTGLTAQADVYRKKNPNRTVIVTKSMKIQYVAANYQEAKVCLLMHSYSSQSGGEYHRLSEFGPFGCIPVMEQFADSVGMHAYERCGGAVFTNSTHVVPTAADVVARVDQGLYNNRSIDMMNWWKKGVQWESILRTVYGVPSET